MQSQRRRRIGLLLGTAAATTALAVSPLIGNGNFATATEETDPTGGVSTFDVGQTPATSELETSQSETHGDITGPGNEASNPGGDIPEEANNPNEDAAKSGTHLKSDSTGGTAPQSRTMAPQALPTTPTPASSDVEWTPPPTPYVTWEVKDGSTYVGGAGFTLQGPRSGSGNNVTWTNTVSVADCVATSAAECTGPDLNPNPGQFAVKQIGDHTISQNSRYRVKAQLPPTGYKFSPTTGDWNAWKEMGTQGNFPGGVHSFGNFPVTTAEENAFTPSCEAGNVYSIRSNGQIAHINANATPPDIPIVWSAPSPSVTSMNGIGIGYGGAPVIAYNRTNSNTTATFYMFNTNGDGKWTNTEVSQRTGVALIAGAVCLYCDQYFFGGFKDNGTKFELWRFNQNTGTSHPVGTVATPTTGLGGGTNNVTWNGDIAFDAAGNLYIVRGKAISGAQPGSGSNLSIITVAHDQIAAAGPIADIDHSLVASTPSNSRVAMAQVNGASFDNLGNLYIGDANKLLRYPPPFTSGTQIGSNTFLGGSSTDLATCGSPPTIELRKQLPDGRFDNGDQFKLTLTLNESGAPWTESNTTTGTASGLQVDQLGPYPVSPGKQYTYKEEFTQPGHAAFYETSGKCYVRSGGELTPIEGSDAAGLEGTVTIPAATGGQLDGAAVVCEFVNTWDSSLKWEKQDVNENLLGGSEWSIQKTGSSNAPMPVEDCVAASAEDCDGPDVDPAAGKFEVKGLQAGDYTLTETQAPDGYVKVPPIPFTMPTGNSAHVTIPVASTVNQKQPTITLMKETCGVEGVDGEPDIDCPTGELSDTDWDLAGGWDLSTTGDAATNPQAMNPDGSSTTSSEGNDKGSAGTWTLDLEDNTKKGEVVISEDPQTPPWRLQEITCVGVDEDGNELTPKVFDNDGTNPGIGENSNVTLSGIGPGEGWECTFRNRLIRKPPPGNVSWTKVGEDKERLAGSEWEIVGPINHQNGVEEQTYKITDCTEAGACRPLDPNEELPEGFEPHDVDPLASGFKVEGLSCGNYQLIETKAPLGYQKLTDPIDFVINGTCNTEGEINPNTVISIDKTVNKLAQTNLPLTGGLSTFLFVALGGALLGAAALAGVALRKRRLHVK